MMTWQYIAGFFDGEGNVNYCHSYPNVNISQTASEGRAVLEEIKQFLSWNGITCSVHCYSKTKYYAAPEKPYRGYGKRNCEWNNIYRLDIGNRESVVKFLRGVFPFLRVKKTQAQDCLRYAALFPGLRTNKFWLNERVQLMAQGRINKSRIASLEVI